MNVVDWAILTAGPYIWHVLARPNPSDKRRLVCNPSVSRIGRERQEGRGRAVYVAGLFVVPAGRRVFGRACQARRYHRAVVSCRLLELYRLDRSVFVARRFRPPARLWPHHLQALVVHAAGRRRWPGGDRRLEPLERRQSDPHSRRPEDRHRRRPPQGRHRRYSAQFPAYRHLDQRGLVKARRSEGARRYGPRRLCHCPAGGR